MNDQTLRRLFTKEPRLTPFDDEVKTVLEGRKAMSVVETSKAVGDPTILRETAGYIRLRKQVSDKSLLWIEKEVKGRRTELIRIYIVSPAEKWRVDAYDLLYRVASVEGWNYALERIKSELLGYPSESVDRWIDSLKRTSCGWGMLTVYMLLNDEYTALLSTVGFGCLPQSRRADLGHVFVMSDEELSPIADIRSIVKKRTLCRVGARHDVFSDLFARSKPGKQILFVSLDETVLKVMNKHMETKIHLWDGKSWSPSLPV